MTATSDQEGTKQRPNGPTALGSCTSPPMICQARAGAPSPHVAWARTAPCLALRVVTEVPITAPRTLLLLTGHDGSPFCGLTPPPGVKFRALLAGVSRCHRPEPIGRQYRLTNTPKGRTSPGSPSNRRASLLSGRMTRERRVPPRRAALFLGHGAQRNSFPIAGVLRLKLQWSSPWPPPAAPIGKAISSSRS